MAEPGRSGTRAGPACRRIVARVALYLALHLIFRLTFRLEDNERLPIGGAPSESDVWHTGFGFAEQDHLHLVVRRLGLRRVRQGLQRLHGGRRVLRLRRLPTRRLTGEEAQRLEHLPQGTLRLGEGEGLPDDGQTLALEVAGDRSPPGDHRDRGAGRVGTAPGKLAAQAGLRDLPRAEQQHVGPGRRGAELDRAAEVDHPRLPEAGCELLGQVGDKAGAVDHPDDDRGDHRFALTTSSGVTPFGVV